MTYLPAIVLAALLAPQAPAERSPDVVFGEKSEAVVCAISGTVRVHSGKDSVQRLALFDWVQRGSRVEVGPESRVVLTFRSGKRFELAASASARVKGGDLGDRTGIVNELPGAPELPRLPQAEDADGSSRPPETAIRNLYPSGGAAVLPGRTLLRFDVVKPGMRYRIELLNAKQQRAFAVETAANEASVPGGILEPGQAYTWLVRTLDPAAPVEARAEFTTLDETTAQARALLYAEAKRTNEPSLLALSAEVDRRLGLFREAEETLRAHLKLAPGDADVARQLRVVEALVRADSASR